MDIYRVLELLDIEHKCSQSDCDRDCGKCSLVQEQSELDELYTEVKRIIKDRINKYKKIKIKKEVFSNSVLVNNLDYIERLNKFIEENNLTKENVVDIQHTDNGVVFLYYVEIE